MTDVTPAATPAADVNLDDLTATQLREYAQEKGIEIPDGIKEKAALRYIIELAERQALSPVADVKPDATKEKTRDLPDGRVEARRPVSEVNEHGDWRDPFSGLLIFHGQATNPENRATVDLPADRRRRKDAASQVYVPVEKGDDVVLIRDEVD